MAWLEGWSNRLEFTIDGARVDGDLTDFPVLITLASGSGRNNFDTTIVFDELLENTYSSDGFNPDDAASSITVTSGSLVAYKNSGTGWAGVRGVDSRNSGLLYFEVTCDVMAGTRFMIGVAKDSENLTYPGQTSAGWGYHSHDGGKYNAGYVGLLETYTQGDIIGVAVNLNNGKIWWSKNGVWLDGGSPADDSNPSFSNVSGPIYAMVGLYDTTDKVSLNLGTSAFAYTIPAGFEPFNKEYVDNTQKIAVTDYTGGVQLPVEVSFWNWPDEIAHLWTKVPALTSGTDATLYLYYDSTQLNNDLYVGNTGTTPAKDVWDDGYVAVWHFTSSPVDALEDSTSNIKHASPINLEGYDIIDYNIWDFDGSNEYARVLYDVDFAPTAALTCEAAYYFDDWASDQRIISKTQTGGYQIGVNEPTYYSGDLGAIFYLAGAYRTVSMDYTTLQGDWHYTAASFDGQYLKLIVDDSLVDTYNHGSTTTIGYTQTNALIIAGEAGTGSTPDPGPYMDGKIKELRVSNIGRSDAWLTATNYTVFDNFMTVASGGTPPDPDPPDPAWQESWANFYEIEIDKDRIDASLENFPVLVTLTSGAGTNNFDATDIFNHLTESGIDSYVSFMMPTDGDRSASQHDAIAFAWNPTITTVSGISCISLNNSNQCIVVIEEDHADWGFDLDDFTLEAHINNPAYSDVDRIMAHGAAEGDIGSWCWGVGYHASWGSGRRMNFAIRHGGGVLDVTSPDLTSYLTTNEWHRVSVSRQSGMLYMFVDGHTVHSGSCNYNLTSSSSGERAQLFLGARVNTSTRVEHFNGYLARLAIHKGIARWTSDYAPQEYPTNDSYTKFLYRIDGDGSQWKHDIEMISDPEVHTSNPATDGRGYWYFDADGTPEEDHIEVPHHSSLSLTSADFTIEFYFKTINTSSARNMLTKRTGTPYENFIIRQNTSRQVQTYIANAAGSNWQLSFSSSQGTVPNNEWTYYTLVREGTAIRVYLNGIRVYQSTLSGDIYDSGSSPLNIGGRGDGVDNYYGYIQGLRISKGIARYTADRFFPPDPPDGDSGENRKKIQFADADHNRLYTEIEGWDHANGRAWLWTKVPYVASGTNTTLYLYYDRTQDDNTEYVGDIGQTPAQQVWTDNFSGVWHMSINQYVETTTPLYDSTANSHHMATGGFSGEAVFQRVDGLITQGTLFENVQYYYDYTPADDETLDLTTNYTLEAMFIPTADHSGDLILSKASSSTTGYQLRGDSGTGPNFYTGTGTVNGRTNWQNYGWQYVTAVCLVSGTGTILYLDGSQYATGSTTGTPVNSSTFYLGRNWAGNYFNGTITEVRASTVPRSASYAKANYYNLWDDLLSWTAGVRPVYTASGTTTVDGLLTNGIPVRLYRRSTGELMDSSLSEDGGRFTLNSIYNEDHYVIGLYTASGTNALIYDWIAP